MQGATCELIALGDWSPWARQLLNQWQQEEFVSLSFENQVSSFCQQTGGPQTKPQIVILENDRQSRNHISLLKSSGRELLILWMSQNFSVEDLSFALDHQVYACIDNSSINKNEILKIFTRAVAVCEQRAQGLHVLSSLRQLVMQDETREGPTPFTQELKTGLVRLQKTLLPNDLFHSSKTQKLDESTLPIAQNQSLSDTLLTLFEFQRTGTLWIRGSHTEQEGKIDFLQGKIIHAETGSVIQLKAIYRMFLWNDCRYLFSRKNPEDFSSEKIIPLEMEALVQTGELQRKRFKEIEHWVPPRNLKVGLLPGALSTATQLDPDEFHALTQVVEYHEVSSLLDFSAHWDIDLYEGLIRLKKSGLLKVMAS